MSSSHISVNAAELGRVIAELEALRSGSDRGACKRPEPAGQGITVDLLEQTANLGEALYDTVLSLMDATLAFLTGTRASFQNADEAAAGLFGNSEGDP